MTFDEYWHGQGEPLASNAEKRAIAMMAWDAALCAVQAGNYDSNGYLRTGVEMAAALSALHTWITQPSRPSDSPC